MHNIIWGTLRGLLGGATLCAIAILLRIVRGGHFLDRYGIGFGSLLLCYLGGGLGVGAIAGAGRPILRWRVGAIAIGVVGGLFAFAAVVFGIRGPVRQWGPDYTFAVWVAGIAGGAWMGNALWEDFVEPTLPRPLPPGPPPPRPPFGLWRP